MALASEHPDVDSFYHLDGVDLDACSCRGTACFAASHRDPERWARALAQSRRVHCLGKCYAAPANGADAERPHVEVTSSRAVVLERIVRGGAHTIHDYWRMGGFDGLKSALTRTPEGVMAEIERSGLRGRGGAGFPTATKWRAAASHPIGERLLVANLDEGDPGVFGDRFIVEDDPFCLLEGMIIAGYAIGARRAWIYVRKEYPRALRSLRDAITATREAGLLRGPMFGDGDTRLDIQLVEGRGGYVCGEETSLLNSIAGARPVVVPRPPHCAERGLYGMPTVVNNVETLACIPWILRYGGSTYARMGFSKSRGTKLLSLGSTFNRPGLYEVEFGISLRHVVEKLGGGLRWGALKALLVGGPLAGLIPPGLLDCPLGFEEMQAIGASVGHGGVVAFDRHTSIPALVHHVFSFAAFESCGQCAPCRLGAKRVEQLFERILAGTSAGTHEQAEFTDIVDALGVSSMCAFGSGLAEFARSVLRHYPEELRACFE
jgi:NADH:ubiquinone oxidoreductase subunit F (NADH-binding)